MPSATHATPTIRPASAVPAGDRMRAKDLAIEENCSTSTACRLMRSGALGPVRGRSQRDRWIDRRAYAAWLDGLGK